MADPTDKEMDDIVEYEMDEADMIFVNQTIVQQKLFLKEEKFEQIVDRLEKESYKLVSTCIIISLRMYLGSL